MSPKKGTRKPAKRAGFTADERAAMKEYVQELKGGTADGESAVLAKVGAMKEPDRSMAKRVHAIVKASAPMLSPRTWYGMPAYANQDGKVVEGSTREYSGEVNNTENIVDAVRIQLV